jgi:hypothetical protein
MAVPPNAVIHSTETIEGISTLWHGGNRMIRVIGTSPQESGTVIDLIMPEASMWVAMVDYGEEVRVGVDDPARPHRLGHCISFSSRPSGLRNARFHDLTG